MNFICHKCLLTSCLVSMLILDATWLALGNSDHAGLLDNSSGSNQLGQPQTVCQTNLSSLSRVERGASANLNINMNFDVVRLKNKIEKWTQHSKPGERVGFVKGLVDMLCREAPKGYHAMVYNLNQDYRRGLVNVIAHKQVHEHDAEFGMWVFQCGTFMNPARRGRENWAYCKSNGLGFQQGKGYIFTHPDCPNPAYRIFNHYILHNRDYRVPNKRTFFDVESVEECAIWTMEMDENVAIYEPRPKMCHVKGSGHNSGVSFDREGIMLGNYDLGHEDVEETTDESRPRLWIRERRCDLIHSRDEKHWCKVYPYDSRFVLFIRRRN